MPTTMQTLREATDAALEYARAGYGTANALDNVATRFSLSAADRDLIEVRVDNALAHERWLPETKATVAKVGAESLLHTPDDAALHLRQIRALAKLDAAPSVVISARAHAATIRLLRFQLGEVVEAMRLAGLLAGDDLAVADAKVAQLHVVMCEADAVASEIDLATRSGRLTADAFGGKAGA